VAGSYRRGWPRMAKKLSRAANRGSSTDWVASWYQFSADPQTGETIDRP
jgi:hypothetical protein